MLKHSLLLLIVTSSLSAAPVTFTQSVIPLPGGSTPVTLTAGDFNGDGKRDFAYGNETGTSSVVSNLLGFAGFRVPGGVVSPVRVEVGAADDVLADLDNDDVDDWCQLNPGAKQLFVLSGGSSSHSSVRTFTRTPAEVQAADFDDDGKLDVLVGFTGSPAAVLRGNGDASTGAPIDVQVLGQTLTIADLDGDGAMDILSGGVAPVRVGLSRGTGALTFSEPLVVATFPGGTGALVEGMEARTVRAGELPTIAAVVLDSGAHRRTLYVVRPIGNADPQEVTDATGQLHAVFADINRDSVPDLVVGDTALRKIFVYSLSAGESWNAIAEVDVAPSNISALVATDVTGDGLPDIAFTDRAGSRIVVLVNTTESGRRRALRH